MYWLTLLLQTWTNLSSNNCGYGTFTIDVKVQQNTMIFATMYWMWSRSCMSYILTSFATDWAKASWLGPEIGIELSLKLHTL